MDSDLFVAILAMDAYNRGYQSNLSSGDTLSGTDGVQIGNATVLTTSTEKLGLSLTSAAGFYAVAYDWGGSTVISYRGTNEQETLDSQNGQPTGNYLPVANDLLNGWSLFDGIGTNSQAVLAQQFYNSVFPSIGHVTVYSAILTGHSLGGALAGYIAAATNPASAKLFDPVPYGVAAWENALSSAFSAALADSGLTLPGLALVAAEAVVEILTGPRVGQQAIGQFVTNFAAELEKLAPSLSGIVGYVLDGEVASAITVGQIIVGSLTSSIPILGSFTDAGYTYLTGKIEAAVGQSQLLAGLLNLAVENRSSLRDLTNPGDVSSHVDLHSQSLLVTYMFGEPTATDLVGEWVSEGGNNNWISAAPYIFPSMFETEGETIATDLGLKDIQTASASAQMLTEIAYSAINEGTMPFGDAAIRGLYSDADIIGAAHNNNSGNPNSYFSNSLNEIGEIVVEFAGYQAQQKAVIASGDPVTDSGILSADYGNSSSNGLQGSSNVTSLSIDVSQQTWGDTVIAGKDDLLSSLSDDATPAFGKTVNGAYSEYLSQQMDAFAGVQDIATQIQEVNFDFDAQTIGSTVKGLSDGYLLTVLNDSSNSVNIDSGNNIVFSGNGSDTIHVSSGISILIGGSGKDTFYGGTGRNFFYGSGTQSTFYGGSGLNEFLQSGGNTYVGKKGATKNEILLNKYLGVENVNVSQGVIASTGQVSHFSGVQYFIGNDSHDIFYGGGKSGVFVAGAAGADFHLTNGDVAIGSLTGPDNFYITTTLVNGKIPNVTIVNFKTTDKLYVNGVLFTGYNKTLTGYGVVDHRYTGGDPLTVLQEYGQSSYAITNRKVSNPTGEGSNPQGWTTVHGVESPPNVSPFYKESPALYQPGEINDVTYSAATGAPNANAGTILFTSQSGSQYLAGVNVNIVSSYGNFGTSGPIQFQETYKYIGYYQTENADPYQLQTADAQTWSQTANPHSANWINTTSYQQVVAGVDPSDLANPGSGGAVPNGSAQSPPAGASNGNSSSSAAISASSGSSGGSVLAESGQVLVAGGNTNTLVGRGGGDTFVVNQGDGVVAIQESDNSASASNVLQLGPGLLASQAAISADSSGAITLTFASGDAVVLENALNSGAGQTYGVQSVRSADGSVLHYADLLADLETPSSSQTVLYGDSAANVLDSKGIARTIVGNGGGDTFIYDRGYGALVINEADTTATLSNVLQIGAGISPASLTVTGNGTGDMILSFGGGDTIALTNGLASSAGVAYGVQDIVFADGTTLSYANLLALAETPSAGQTTLYGDNGPNVLDGKGIAQTLIGSGGGDTFTFIQCYGTLTIDEVDDSAKPANILQFGEGLAAVNLAVAGNANGDLILTFGGGDQVILTNALNSANGATCGVQEVVFADGTALAYVQLLAMADNPSATNTTLYGDSGANTLDGQGIAHTLVGNGGRDSFIFNRGYGALTIVENDPVSRNTNALQLGAGLIPANTIVTADANGDFVLDFGGGDVVTIQGALNAGKNTSSGIQQVNFADGTTWTYAGMLALADTGTATNTALFGDGAGDSFDTRGFATSLSYSRGRADRFGPAVGRGRGPSRPSAAVASVSSRRIERLAGLTDVVRVVCGTAALSMSALA